MTSPRPVQAFARKRTTETLPLAFDFTNVLPSEVTISSAGTTLATVASDSTVEDASPSDIVSGSASVSGTKVAQTITAGVDGVKYFLKFIANGSDSKIYEGEAGLLVSDATKVQP